MKKAFYIFMGLCLISCTNYSYFNEEPINITKKTSGNHEISQEEAVTIATKFAAMVDKPSRSSRSAQISNVVEYKNRKQSRSIKSSFHVVNFDNGEGFAIVSKKNIANPVIALIDEGTYNSEIEIDNPGFNYFMENAESTDITIRDDIDLDSLLYIPDSIPSPDKPVIIPATKYKEVKDTLAYKNIRPKIQYLTWGQVTPEGDLCPNNLSGCGPTAMAMVIAHLAMPNSMLTYTFPERRINSEIVDWNNVRLHEFPGDYRCGTAAHRTIAHLCRELGYRANATYNITETETYIEDYPAVLKSILKNRFISSVQGYYYPYLINYLDHGLVIMSGREYIYKSDGSVEKGKGHAWVVDGCYYLYVKVLKYHKEYTDSDWIYDGERYDTTQYLTINWGWQGEDNSGNASLLPLKGYYNALYLDPDNIKPEDYPNTKASYRESKYVGIY